MKIYILALLLFLSLSLSSLAQDINKLPPLVLDKEKLREIIKKGLEPKKGRINLLRVPPIQEKDIDSLLYLRNMYITPTSAGLDAKTNIDTTRILILSPSSFSNVYLWNLKDDLLGAMSSARYGHLALCARMVTERESCHIDSSMMFNIWLFPNEKYEVRFGSKENYIETYNFRTDWNIQNKINRQNLFEKNKMLL